MNKKIKEWKKAFQGKNIYTVKIDDEDVQVVEVADALIEIDQALKAQREEMIKEIEDNLVFVKERVVWKAKPEIKGLDYLNKGGGRK
jgi:hypothetical protein